jgi:monofunctional biosynthetic peptidoglycan transglycosylase
VFGAEAAARYHFGVPAAGVDAAQAAWLASILPSPRRYERGASTPYLQARIDTIRGHMSYAQIP